MGRKPHPLLKEVEVVDLDVKGRGVVKHDQKVAFVKDTIPGDIIDAQVIKKKKGIQEAVPVKYHQRSEDFVPAFCNHFDDCGGCKLQNLTYEKQLFYKQKMVLDAFQRIAKVPVENFIDILGSQQTTRYRNKLDFAFSCSRWITKKEAANDDTIENPNALGFHVAGRFDKILHVDECHLQPEPVNAIRNLTYDYCIEHNLSFYDIKAHTGIMRALIVRDNGEGEFMVTIMLGEDRLDDIKGLVTTLVESFPEIKSVFGIVNLKLNDSIHDQDPISLYGDPFLKFPIGHLTFQMGPKSFMQTNSKQTLELYKLAAQGAALTGNEVVYDLFCGVGTIGMFVAQDAKEVIGIETVEEAIEMAKENAQHNGIANARFLAGSVEYLMNEEFTQHYPSPDVVITDPPRVGMHKDVVKMLLQMAPKRIVYVSCNPSTQARDVAMLDEKYAVKSVQPVDMFPHTPHVESVAVLELKQ